MAIGFCNFIYM